ncbi:MAG: 30S ribosomal protein S9 [Candidatus Pacebacteria bacterium]|nr:30S ribosomal protein S9 [Candidatus Paceibacterota bacterium]
MAKAKKETVKEKEIKKEHKPSRYIEARGGRKTSVARVRLFSGQSGITINGKDLKDYFKNPKHQEIVLSALFVAKDGEKYGVTVVVKGGGLTGQAEAIRHGIAGALVKSNEEFRKRLRKMGYLTRDSRMVERKKYGLKKARRAPQWAKR